jgi:hypothetical protein
LEVQKSGSPEVRKSRSPEVQKSRSPEVQKSRSPVITISGDAKGVSVVAGLVPATSRMGNEKAGRQKTEAFGSPEDRRRKSSHYGKKTEGSGKTEDGRRLVAGTRPATTLIPDLEKAYCNEM